MFSWRFLLELILLRQCQEATVKNQPVMPSILILVKDWR